jgi:putative hemolysin
MGELLIALIFILIAGCVVASEAALLSIGRNDVIRFVEENRRGAKSLMKLFQVMDHLVQITRIISLFLLLIAAAISGMLIVHLLEPILRTFSYEWLKSVSYPLSLLFTIILMLVFIQLVVFQIPRLIGRKYSVRIALLTALPLRWGIYILHPVITLVNSVAGLFLSGESRKKAASVSRPEIQHTIEVAKRSGIIESSEYEIINRVLEFSRTTAKEIMIPRPDIVALEMDTTRDEIIRVVTEEGFSRIPVYKESIDNIVGIIYAKDLITMIAYDEIIALADVIRPANFVPETKRISQLLREFQQQKIHLAIVIDEFGGTEGIVTLEDIIEEIIGEIHDEYDEVKLAYIRNTDGTWVVDGGMNISDFNLAFSAQVPEDVDYETINGFLHKVTGRLPSVNEEIQFGNLSFTILRKSARRIEKIRVQRYQQKKNI